ncbi:MAG: hypothetical protein IRY97_11860, partial [Thermomicrobiaceae bacterium]|nr:hypothetical protein [Thermomicrobiaceae bacterium]
RQDVPPATLALFAEGAGDLLAASELLVVAARQAEALFAYPEAERLYRRALLLAEEARAEPARRDELRLAFADSIKRADRETAVREVEAIAMRARLRGDALGLARARQRLALFAYEAGQRSAAAAMLDEVIPALEAAGDLPTLGQALVCLGYCRQSASDFPALEAVARRLLALADELGDPEYRATGLHFIATARVARGEPEQAPELERESVEMLAELARYDLAAAYAAVALVRVDLLANLRRPSMVEKLIRRGEELDRQASARLGLAPGQCTAEFCYWRLLRGAWERVRAELPDPRAFASQAEPQSLKDVVHTIAAELALAEGRSGEAEALLRYIAPAPEAPLGEHSYQQWLFAV